MTLAMRSSVSQHNFQIMTQSGEILPMDAWTCFRCGTRFSYANEHELCGRHVIGRHILWLM